MDGASEGCRNMEAMPPDAPCLQQLHRCGVPKAGCTIRCSIMITLVRAGSMYACHLRF